NARTKAHRAVDQALEPDQLNGRSKNREPEKVAGTVTSLAEARAELLTIANELSDVSYQEAQVEDRRKLLEQFLRKLAEFCELTECYLTERREFIDGSQEV